MDEFFSTPYYAKGICRDCTGVIGQYVQGNQPDQQTAYYYAWAGQPWKTQELTRRILANVRKRQIWLGVSRNGRSGFDLIVVCDECNGLLPGRSIQSKLHLGQSDF